MYSHKHRDLSTTLSNAPILYGSSQRHRSRKQYRKYGSASRNATRIALWGKGRGGSGARRHDVKCCFHYTRASFNKYINNETLPPNDTRQPAALPLCTAGLHAIAFMLRMYINKGPILGYKVAPEPKTSNLFTYRYAHSSFYIKNIHKWSTSCLGHLVINIAVMFP